VQAQQLVETQWRPIGPDMLLTGYLPAAGGLWGLHQSLTSRDEAAEALPPGSLQPPAAQSPPEQQQPGQQAVEQHAQEQQRKLRQRRRIDQVGTLEAGVMRLNLPWS